MKWLDETDGGSRSAKNSKDALRGNDFANDLLKKKEIARVKNHTKSDAVQGTLRARGLSLAFITGVKNMDKMFREVVRKTNRSEKEKQ